MLPIYGWGVSYEIALRWLSQDFTYDISTLVQVMAWCRQATTITWANVVPDHCRHMPSLGLNEINLHNKTDVPLKRLDYIAMHEFKCFPIILWYSSTIILHAALYGLHHECTAALCGSFEYSCCLMWILTKGIMHLSWSHRIMWTGWISLC